MAFEFQPTPHVEAAGLLEGKTAVAKKIFSELLPELRARAFTVAGIESVNLLEQIRDEVAALPKGQTWKESKAQIAEYLEPSLGADGAERRAEMVLRVNGFQAFSAASWRACQEDDGTTHLQYLHGDCQVPTPSHLALNGVILPKDDPFWLTHTGPWGHLGCVCYFRSMSPDQVADEKSADEKRAPEEKLVFEGPMLAKLNEGTLIRGARTFDVKPPEGPDAFRWHPGDLRIPLNQIRLRYDPEVWRVFVDYCKKAKLDKDLVISLWDFLHTEKAVGNGMFGESIRLPERSSGPMQSRMELAEAKEKIKTGMTVPSESGNEVRFGQILHRHFERGADDQRARFLPAAQQAVRDPIEVWENNHRHYYIGKFVSRDGKHTGFVVVAARVGETRDEVITFFPKTLKELEKFRKGKLIYAKK